ncbi:MAG: tRNA (adenosine(37)-N6)-dimethylallyltransferase MiaA [Dehalococcoidia bacterium]
MIVILGATGTGKSEIGMNIARALNGEIINADSRQIYKRMTIGTAKPTRDDMQSVPHHLFDFRCPDENFSVFEFMELVSHTESDIRSRGKIPILVGGTGQYLSALLENWSLNGGPPNQKIRNHLTSRLENLGISDLVEELTNKDPESARTIDLRNPRRVVRALEKLYNSDKKGKFPSNRAAQPPLEMSVFGIQMPRKHLYARVDLRTDNMVRNGWIIETQNLLDTGYELELPAMGGIGYKEISQYLNGNSTWESCITRIKSRTHRLIRSQNNWFNRIDRPVVWFDSHELGSYEISRQITDLIS